MPYKILIRRLVPEHKEKELLPILLELRCRAMMHSGYISGETLRRIDNPGEELVISTWHTLEDWRNWLTSSERMQIQSKIDRLLGEKTQFEIYTY